MSTRVCEHTQSFMLAHWLTHLYPPYSLILTDLPYILFQPSLPLHLLFSQSICYATLDKLLHFSGLSFFPPYNMERSNCHLYSSIFKTSGHDPFMDQETNLIGLTDIKM